MKFLIIYFFLFFVIIGIYGHDQDVHKYMTSEAWELVKYYHPEVTYSEMSWHFGGWQNGTLNDPPYFRTETIMSGAYREDEEDVVYGRNGLWYINPTNSHFWDGFGDNTSFHPPPYSEYYPNSYQKMLSYWDGSQTYYNNISEVWLELNWYNQTYYNVLIPYRLRI